MPATDSSSSSSSSPAAAPLSSIGRSIRSLRRDQNQIHSFPPPPDATDAFQRRAAQLLADLPAADDVLSLAWTRRLLESFLLCLEEFRALLFGSGDSPAARPPLDRLVADFSDRAVKALDLCNAVRNGLWPSSALQRRCAQSPRQAELFPATTTPSTPGRARWPLRGVCAPPRCQRPPRVEPPGLPARAALLIALAT